MSNDILSRSLIAVLVHGTFTPDAPWTRDGSFFRETLARYCVHQIRFVKLAWSGKNSHAARFEVARDLRHLVSALRSEQRDARIVVVAHSHGGNIAMLSQRDVPVDAVVCMSTPFLEARPRYTPALAARITKASPYFTWSAVVALGFGGIYKWAQLAASSNSSFVVIGGIVLLIAVELTLAGATSALNEWSRANAERLASWISGLYAESAIDYGFFPGSANLLVMNITRDEAWLWLTAMSWSTRLIDVLRNIAQHGAVALLTAFRWLFLSVCLLAFIGATAKTQWSDALA